MNNTKNNFLRPKTTNYKNFQSSKQRGFSNSSKNFFPSIYRQKQVIQFNNNKNNNNFNNFGLSNTYYFWDKEKLFDKCMKLQNELNFLHQQYKFQKVENKQQNQLIKRQNVILNKYNNISNHFYSPSVLENEKPNNNNNNYYIDNNNELNEKKNKENIEIENMIDENLKNIKRSSSNVNFNLEKEKDELNNKKTMKKSQSEFYNTKIKINQMKKNQILKVKIAGETLISNLKIRCKQLTKENKEKDEIIKDMKKNMKLSNINELQKENSIFENEIHNMKNKLFEAFDKIYYYEKKESQMKLLFEQLKKKDKKINILEQENNKLVNQYTNIINELERDNELKYKKILNQENLIKKLYMNEKNKEKNYNLNSKRELSDKEEKEIKEIINNNNINQDKKKEIQLNKELKIIREGKNNDNNNNKNIIQRFKGIEEFYHLYIEMKKKGINSPESFFSYSINTLSENLSIDENIIIYADGIIKLLGIKTKEERSIVLDYANKFFKNLKNINLLKEKQTYIMNEIFKEEKQLKGENEIDIILSKLDQDKVKDIFDKYDLKRNGIVSFENMRNAINELNLNEIEEEILLLTKDNDIFNCMKYFEILHRINNDNSKEESLYNNIKVSSRKNDDYKKIIYNKNDLNINNDIVNKNNINDNKKEEKKESEEEYKFEDNEEVIENDEKNNLDDKLIKLGEKIKINNVTPLDFFSSVNKVNININDNNKIIGILINDLIDFLNKNEIILNSEEKEDLKIKFKNENCKEDNIIDFSLLEKKLLTIINNNQKKIN